MKRKTFKVVYGTTVHNNLDKSKKNTFTGFEFSIFTVIDQNMF